MSGNTVTHKIRYIKRKAVLVHHTDSAALLEFYDSVAEQKWIPRTCMSFHSDMDVDRRGIELRGMPHEYEIAEWYAQKEGLI